VQVYFAKVYLSLQVIKWSHRRSETVGFEAIDLPNRKALIAGDRLTRQRPVCRIWTVRRSAKVVSDIDRDGNPDSMVSAGEIPASDTN